jgi:protoporphyrin/coproporphyrin ferrochelatase
VLLWFLVRLFGPHLLLSSMSNALLPCVKPTTAVLLVNTGSPDRPDVPAIRRYLGEFLMDRRVIDLPWAVRWALVHGLILPFRPHRIVDRYRRIWQDGVFPLIATGRELAGRLSAVLGADYRVDLAMRYGRPALADVLNEIRAAEIRRLLVIPLFPQYASATGGSILTRVMDWVGRWPVLPELLTVTEFHDHPGFIEAWVENGSIMMRTLPDHVLFSFHGLPQRHLVQADTGGRRCLQSSDCCDHPTAAASGCYRAQCIRSARLIAAGLGLSPERFSIGFQSRLGRTAWIQPYTTEVIDRLAGQGVRRLLVFCPSFVADCLETIEEIQETAAARFRRSGGQVLQLVPSLNTGERWVATLADLVRTRTGGG